MTRDPQRRQDSANGFVLHMLPCGEGFDSTRWAVVESQLSGKKPDRQKAYADTLYVEEKIRV